MKTQEYAYHWTHRNNLPSILWSGLDPTYAEGKLKVVWFCDGDRVGWALNHIACRHGWCADDMVLIRFPKSRYAYANTAFSGVYTTTYVVSMKAHTAVKYGVLGEWKPCRTVRKGTDRPVRIGPDTGN